MSRRRAVAMVAGVWVLAAGRLPAETAEWPGFRGPGAMGISRATGLPERWSSEENVAWSAEIPGRGWSSPIAERGKVFVTTAVSEGELEPPKKGLYYGGERQERPQEPVRWLLLGLDLGSGEILWERTVHRGVPQRPVHIKNSRASETPVTDGERVYAYFGNVGLFAYDLEGRRLWERRWPSCRTRHDWGPAASPALHGDRIYIANDNEERSFLAAIDKHTGQIVWEVDRDEKSNWSTPFVWSHSGRTEIVTAGTGKVRSYSLEGKVLWELEGMSSITIATPYASHGLLYVTSGFILDRQRPIYAIRPGARGNITLPAGRTSSEAIAWSHPQAAPYNPSTLVYGDHLYVLYDRGFLSCFDARSGEEVYGRQRLARATSGFTSSPWAYGGRVFCLSEDGTTFVVRAGAEFEVLGRNALGEMCLATPAIAGRRLLIRTLSKLYAIGEPAPAEAGR